MTDRLPPVAETAIADTVRRDGYAFVRAPEMRALLEAAGLCDWDGFAESWGDLGVDMFMADGGRYRRRRFACFRAAQDAVTRKPDHPGQITQGQITQGSSLRADRRPAFR